MSPSRTSSGGTAFTASLVPELERLTGSEVIRGEVPPTGRVQLSREARQCSHVVFLGSRAMPVEGASVIFWPLNVAPLERHVVRMANTSPRNRVRHHLLKHRLSTSVKAADALVFGSMHARTLYMSAFEEAATLPYLVSRGGAPSMSVVDRQAPGNRTEGHQNRVVLLVSHLYPYKGVLEFVRAISSIRDRLPPDVRFRIAGADRDATYARRVRRAVDELSLTDRVEIRPAGGAEMQQLYATAELAVFASTCENAGSFALFDGLHAGLPTLCSDRSSMPEMVGTAVRLANPCEQGRFGAELLDLLSDEEARTELSARARAWSDVAPTWATRAEELRDFLATGVGA